MCASYPYSLRPGGLSRLRAPARIHCERGTLWITCEGDARDYLLETGRMYCFEGTGRIVVEAIGEARFSVLGKAATCADARMRGQAHL